MMDEKLYEFKENATYKLAIKESEGEYFYTANILAFDKDFIKFYDFHKKKERIRKTSSITKMDCMEEK